MRTLALILATALAAKAMHIPAMTPRQSVGRPPYAPHGLPINAPGCPAELKKCSECGGDSQVTGQCNDIHWEGSSSGPIRSHCKCTSDKGSGGIPIVPIPIPLIPGAAPLPTPPDGVPPPEAEDICLDDYTQTSCEGCDSIQGRCTSGPQMGCRCRDVCPTGGDELPQCANEGCKGDENSGTCTLGSKKGCKCKMECPNPEKIVIDCEDKTCAGKDLKCTAEKYNRCQCVIIEDPPIYHAGTIAQVQAKLQFLTAIHTEVKRMEKEQQEQQEAKDELDKADFSCPGNYTDAVAVDVSFLEKMADSFCSQTEGKNTVKDLTSKAIGSTAYKMHRFHFEMEAGKNCKADCKAAFKAMASNCQGYDSHSIKPEGSVETKCGARYSYNITPPEPGAFYQDIVVGQNCYKTNEFGEHGDTRDDEYDRFNVNICSQEKTMDSTSSPIEKMYEGDGDSKYWFRISWIDKCHHEPQNTEWPLGGDAKFPDNPSGMARTSKRLMCENIMNRNFHDCINLGTGGSRDVGCLRYEFKALDYYA